MDLNGCVGLSYATTACFRANIEQSGLLHSARGHATIDVGAKISLDDAKPAAFDKLAHARECRHYPADPESSGHIPKADRRPVGNVSTN